MKILNWNQLYSKQDKLKVLQKENLPKIKRELSKLGYLIKSVKEIDDGWFDGFTIYEFKCLDKRASLIDKDKIHTFTGNDDNSAIYQIMPSGGRAYFAEVKSAKKL
jgi:hypothetical protein